MAGNNNQQFLRPGLTLGRFMIVFPTIMIVWVAWVSWMRPNGYCPTTSRHITDNEMFASAVARRVEDIRGLPKNPTSSDIDDYIKQNPDCCVVMRQGPFNEGMLDRLLSSGTWIHVLYELKSEAIFRRQLNDTAYEAFMKVDGCGHTSYFSGIPITHKQMLEKKLANKALKSS